VTEYSIIEQFNLDFGPFFLDLLNRFANESLGQVRRNIVVCGVEISSGSKLIKAGEVQRHFVSTSHYIHIFFYNGGHILLIFSNNCNPSHTQAISSCHARSDLHALFTSRALIYRNQHRLLVFYFILQEKY
jgi:hypothetical protein